MTNIATTDLRIRQLPRLAHFSRSTLWWGICGLIAIEVSVFAGLFTTFIYLRLGMPSWPPPGIPLPDWKYAALSTALLVVTSYTMQKATTIAVKKNRAPTLLLGISVFLAMVSDVIRFVEFADLPFRWDDHAYASIFWTIKGLHSMHVIAAFLGTGLIAVIAAIGPMTRLVQIAIEVDGVYWQFVVWVWVPMFFVIYVLPRLV